MKFKPGDFTLRTWGRGKFINKIVAIEGTSYILKEIRPLSEHAQKTEEELVRDIIQIDGDSVLLSDDLKAKYL